MPYQATPQSLSDRVQEMLQAHPNAELIPELPEVIQACQECQQTSVLCADACMSEPNVAELIDCIRRNQDCAYVCAATATILSRQHVNPELRTAILRACVITCRVCADECAKHEGHMLHCRLACNAARACQAMCHRFLTHHVAS